MPHSQKPIICINGSRNITELILDNFINASTIGAIVTGGAKGVDTIAEHGAKSHNLEGICYLPQGDVYGKRAGMIRNKEMLDFADALISFGDGKSIGTKQAIEYAIEINKPYQVHLIQQLD